MMTVRRSMAVRVKAFASQSRFSSYPCRALPYIHQLPDPHWDVRTHRGDMSNIQGS